MREVVIPEVDTYTLGVMCEKAGNKPEAVKSSSSSIYDMIFDANSALDDAEVPDLGRVLVVTPATLLLMKTSKDNNGRYQDMISAVLDESKRRVGFVGNLDGSGRSESSGDKTSGKLWFYGCASVRYGSTDQVGKL